MMNGIKTISAPAEAGELSMAVLDDVAGGESVVEVARLAALAACLAGGGHLTDHATVLK